MFDDDLGMSDRDRLAFAFDELRRRGIHAVVEPGQLCCCYLSGLQFIERGLPPGAKGFAFWTRQRDVLAFGETAVQTACEHDGTAADPVVEMGSDLVRVLPLYWRGPVDLIVHTLREWGLEATFPNGTMSSIEVHSLASLPRPRGTTRSGVTNDV